VYWETGSEINTFGFTLYRSEIPNRSTALPVTEALISSKSINGGGGIYEFADTTIVSGHTYYYWLQEVETTGRLYDYGPVRINSTAKLFLPVLSRS